MAPLFSRLVAAGFGGAAVGALGWESAGGAVGWQKSAAAPPWRPHTGSLAVTLPDSGKVLLIAGQAGEHGGALFDCFNCTNEVWSFEPETERWEDLSAGVPWDPRWGHSATVTTDGTVWMLFGCCAKDQPTVMLRDIWTYNPAKGVPWTMMKSSPPFEGIQATSVALRGDDEIWIVGGWSQQRGTLSHVAMLSTKTLEWTKVSGDGKAPWKSRADHATAISPDGHWLYLYAGQHLDRTTKKWFRLADTWRVPLPAAGVQDWQELGEINAPRSSVPTLLLPTGWLLAMGGHFVPDDQVLEAKQSDTEGMIDHHRKATFKVYNDVSAMNLADATPKWQVVEPNAPWTARDDFAATVTKDGAVLLFGGGTLYGGGGYLHDVWRLPEAAKAYGLAAGPSAAPKAWKGGEL